MVLNKHSLLGHVRGQHQTEYDENKKLWQYALRIDCQGEDWNILRIREMNRPNDENWQDLRFRIGLFQK